MAEQNNNLGYGCLSFCISVIVAAVFTAIIYANIKYNILLIFIGTLFFANRVTPLLFRKTASTSTFKTGKTAGFIILGIISAGLFYLYNSTSKDRNIIETVENTIDTRFLKTGTDSVKVFTHNRTWRDYYGASYSSEFMVREQDYHRLKNQTDNFKYTGQATFWGDLYALVSTNDDSSLDLVYNAFESLKTSENLNAKQFADMVVTMVQDMPYALVLEGACLAPEFYEEDFAELLRECPSCCIGNKRFGLQNPVSYLANLKGDCDTRTVLIYTILSHFGYDIAILNSDYYMHSILGINLPTSGQYKTYRGKKYYVWETTSQNFTMGTLPQNFKDFNNWYILLTNN